MTDKDLDKYLKIYTVVGVAVYCIVFIMTLIQFL